MEVYRVTTSASRNKGQIRYGTFFRAFRIWLANKGQPGNDVKIEVMRGEFVDVTQQWKDGSYEPEKEGDTVPDSASSVVHDTRYSEGTGWPQ